MFLLLLFRLCVVFGHAFFRLFCLSLPLVPRRDITYQLADSGNKIYL